jgi:hypothetical protein
MKRSWTKWVAPCSLALALLASGSSATAELRSSGGPRNPYRLAALQVDEFEEEMADEGTLEEPPPPASPPPSPRTAPKTPSRPPMPPPPPPPPVSNYAVPKSGMPMSPPAWDADVIAPYGGPAAAEACYRGDPGWGCSGTWGSVEYLLWWRKGRNIPPLVTTSTTVIDQDVDAELGRANTRILLGDNLSDARLTPGGRLDVGIWLDRCQTTGVGFRYAGLADDRLNYRTDSTVNPVLAVPFFNLDPLVNAEDTLLVAHPLDNTTGSIAVQGTNFTNLGDIYLRFPGAQACNYRIDVLAGYFFSRVNEDLVLQTATRIDGVDVLLRDSFRARNVYNGFSLGLLGEFERQAWKVNGLAKVAFTNVEQTSIIDGATVIGGQAQTPASGLFTQQSNIGTLTNSQFAVVPEFGINWAYRIGCNADVTFGYSFVYWSDVIRPGEQISRRIDPTQTAHQPAARLVQGDYWVQGINFGLAWRY